MSSVPVKCEYAVELSISKVKPHPKNPNKHSDEQIQRLAKLIKYQGWRHPVIISTLSDQVVAGHGRLAAAKLLGLTTVPIDYQDFKDEDQEYSFLVADNAISEWAELDMAQINVDFTELGPDFDLDQLGLKDFVIEPADKFEIEPVIEQNEKIKENDLTLVIKCPDELTQDDLYREMLDRNFIVVKK